MRYETLSHLFLTRLIYTLQEITIKSVHQIWYRSALLAQRQKGQLLSVINNPKQKTIFYFVFHVLNLTFFQVVSRWTWHSLHSVNMGT